MICETEAMLFAQSETVHVRMTFPVPQLFKLLKSSVGIPVVVTFGSHESDAPNALAGGNGSPHSMVVFGGATPFMVGFEVS